MGFWAYCSEAGLDGPFGLVSGSVTAKFASPVNALFECALTGARADFCEVVLTSCHTTSGNVIPNGGIDIAFLDEVAEVTFQVVARRQQGHPYVRGRMVVHQTGTPEAPHNDFKILPDWFVYAFDPATGAVLHTETFYGLSEKDLEDMRKGKGEEVASKYMKDFGREERFQLFSTPEASRGLVKFDLDEKKLIPLKLGLLADG